MTEQPPMDPVKFKPVVTLEKGGVGLAITVLAISLAAVVEPRIPGQILEKLPDHTVTVAIGGALGAAWNALKFWGKRRKARKVRRAA